MFDYQKDETFPEKEEKILDFWKKQRIFQKSLEKRKNSPLFSFYDGPPFATGLPHYGHLLAGTIKDIIPRYKTMKGYFVPRRFGWDCHGLPVENEIEKAKELSGASSIEGFGIGNFNEECRKIVLRYTSQWQNTVERMGRFVDFGHTYKTMDISFMETVWWVFKQLWEKNMVYEGFKVMPFSAKLGTPLSNFEANLNYKNVQDPSVTVIFPLEDEPDVGFLAWTTTPWTLPSNLALMVGPDIDYVKIYSKEHGQKFILAKKRLQAIFKESPYEIMDEFKGSSLRNIRYLPIFPYFNDHNEAFKVIESEHVSTEDGTGIVHSAPAFGEVDFFACQKVGIELVCPVDNNGRFTHEVLDFEGMLVKDADKVIIRQLKERQRIFSHTQITHRYPFCWRSDTPLIYKAVSTLFVNVEKIKDELIAANQEIHWVPAHIRDGRFGKWLENARDWAISRNRYWGTPIPLWKSDTGEIKVIGSIEELQAKSGVEVGDLHRHFIDDITFVEEGKTYRRISEVFDCWFESGSMPYAQNHFPFENDEITRKAFPADFIAEGLDQTRGWFYTLNVLSVALFKQPAFKNVIVNGIILTEEGTKMSKSLQNYPEPMAVIQRFGADAIRMYMLNSPAVKGEDLRFCEKGVELVLRQILIPFWNAFVFFSTYAKIYQWSPQKKPNFSEILLDRWIVSRLQKLILDVDTALDAYELNQAVEPFIAFIEDLTNWYIRRSRQRFWADEDTIDRRSAFATLYYILLELSKVAAPFIPFLSEAIYQELRTQSMEESVHLCTFPTYIEKLRDKELEEQTNYTQRVVSLGHALRKEQCLKVRQPLSSASIASGNSRILDALQAQEKVICEELNIKKIRFFADESTLVQKIIKPNFRILGKKVGKLLPKIQKLMDGFSSKQIHQLEKGDSIFLDVAGEKITLCAEDVSIEKKIAQDTAAMHDEEIAILIDTHITQVLQEEGIAREIINKINTMRRELGFQVVDRIKVVMDTSEIVKRSFLKFEEYISKEILAVDVKFQKIEGQELDLNGENIIIKIEKV